MSHRQLTNFLWDWTAAQSHRCDAAILTHKPSWGEFSKRFFQFLSALTGEMENQVARTGKWNGKLLVKSVHLQLIVREGKNLAWRVQVCLQAASVFWCNPISTSFGKEGKGEAQRKTKQVLAKPSERTLDPFHRYREGNFQNQRSPCAPNGEVSIVVILTALANRML